ncbi:MAG: 50S ribosomal protein L1 [Nanopusillaceae archaeon]
MDTKVIQELLEKSRKRRFIQTVELIVNLKKTYDLNKSENRFVEYIELPRGKGKKTKIAAVVGPELEKIAKEVFDGVITKDQLKDFGANKREAKKIANRYYIFVAQASVMADLGKFMGKYLSTRNKMPNPKFGMIFPDNITKEGLISIYNRMQKMVRIVVKNHYTFGIPIGTESMRPEELKENAEAVINYLFNKIQKDKIKSIYIKLTMSKSIRIL